MLTLTDILDVLERHLHDILHELGPEWPRFVADLTALRTEFAAARNDIQLELATDRLWEVCRSYPYVWGVLREAEAGVTPVEKGATRGEPRIPQTVAQQAHRYAAFFGEVAAMEKLPTSAQRYAGLSFRDEVALGQPEPLRVAVLLEAPEAGAEPLELTVPPDGWPAQVDALVRVDESDFEIQGPIMLSIEVPEDADSEPVIFTLVPRSLGPKTIAVEFFQAGAYVGRAEVSTTVVEAPERASAAAVRQGLALGGDLLPADLTMRIIERELSQGRMQYRFELLAPDPSLSLYYFNAGMITLEGSPARTLERVFEEMNQTATGGLDYSPEVLEKRLARLGNKYYDDLFPPKLKELYWSTIRGHVNTLQLISDEPWIPWEIIKPYREIAEGNYEEDDFLCQQFSLARWLNRDVFHAPPLSLKLSTLSVVAPSSNLPSVSEEVDALRSLPGVTVKLIQPDLVGVYSLLEGGGSDGLHFASHNVYDRDNPDQSAIALERRQRFRPSDIAGPALRFGREKPIVFLNACETARGEAALTGLGGWVRAFLGAQASCFVGSTWEVEDHAARVFSESFYRALLAGETVGDALRTARDTIRHIGDATWLAYSLYAHPMARLS